MYSHFIKRVPFFLSVSACIFILHLINKSFFFFSSYFAVPKTQLSKYYSGPIEAVANIAQKSGLRGIYRGFPTQIIRDTPANCIYMVLYTFFQYESQHWVPSVPSQIVNFVGGGIAGVLSWLFIMPFDVVKSKLQADAHGLVYKGFWDCARRVFENEGFRAFFLGVIPMAVRAFPVNAVTLMVYSESLMYMKKLELTENQDSTFR